MCILELDYVERCRKTVWKLKYFVSGSDGVVRSTVTAALTDSDTQTVLDVSITDGTQSYKDVVFTEDASSAVPLSTLPRFVVRQPVCASQFSTFSTAITEVMQAAAAGVF